MKRLSRTQRNNAEHKNGWLEPTLESSRRRRAQVEIATGAPPGSLENEGVRSGGFPSIRASRIGSEVSGVPPAGVNRIKITRSNQDAKVVGRIPARSKKGQRKI